MTQPSDTPTPADESPAQADPTPVDADAGPVEADAGPVDDDATARVPAQPGPTWDPPATPSPTARIPRPYAPPPPRLRRRPRSRPLTWRVPVAILIAFLVIFPGAVAIIDAYEKNPFTRALRERLLISSILSAIGFVVLLAFIYVIAYVVSAAWHDARNARRPDDRE